MSIYAVRLVNPMDGEQGYLWYGVVAAKTIYDLFWEIDEYSDPYGFQYKKISLNNAGILWKATESGMPPGTEFESSVHIGGRLAEHFNDYREDDDMVINQSDEGWSSFRYERRFYLSPAA
jgi:hypothetical protein